MLFSQERDVPPENHVFPVLINKIKQRWLLKRKNIQLKKYVFLTKTTVFLAAVGNVPFFTSFM